MGFKAPVVTSAAGFAPRVSDPDLQLAPVAVTSGFVFKPHIGTRPIFDNADTSNARAETDFSLKVDSAPTGTPSTFDTIKYATVAPTERGWRGTVTLAASGVNVAVDTTVSRMRRGYWRKRIVLTADAATVVTLRQAHIERSGESGAQGTYYELLNTLTSINSSIVPVAGATKAATGKATVAIGMIGPDGYTGGFGPNQTNAAKTSNVGGAIVWELSLGISSAGAKQLALAANTPVVLEFAYFSCQVSSLRDFQAAAGRARGLLLGIESDLFKQVMAATAKSRYSRTSDSDSGIFCTPAHTYNGFTFIRDAFWTAIGSEDPELGRLVLKRFGGLISSNKVPVAYNPSAAATAFNGADSNALFLMWMWLLKDRYGVPDDNTNLPTGTQRNNAITGLKALINASGYLVIDSTLSGSGWLDSVKPSTSPTTWSSALTTGLAWVGLKSGKQFDTTQVTQTLLDSVQAAYQSFYNGSYIDWVRDATGGNINPDTGYVEVSALAGEFFANFLFDTKLLTDQQVTGHLDKLFANNLKTLPGGRVLRCLLKSDGTYLDPTQFTNPGSPEKTYAGNYQNGGAWLLFDFMACAVAKYHGYTGFDVDAFWSERRKTELAVDAVSHEFMSVESVTSVDPLGSCHKESYGYGWNTLAAACEDLFGLKYQAVEG